MSVFGTRCAHRGGGGASTFLPASREWRMLEQLGEANMKLLRWNIGQQFLTHKLHLEVGRMQNSTLEFVR